MRTVFLIDDDDDDREIFGEALNTLDLELRLETATNGLEALAKLSQPNFPRPDMIFVDLNMPKMGGREFLVALKKKPNFSDIPVIIYSTSSSPDDIEFTLLNEASSFITKHHSIFELRAQLKKTLQELG
jgi:CheY-like chemotaxis protein